MTVEIRVGDSSAAALAAVREAFARRIPLALLHPRLPPATQSLRAERLLALGGALHFGAGDEATAFVVFTSGTTGEPRPLAISRRAFEAAGRAARHVMPLGPRDRLWLGLPLAHVGGLATVARALFSGATVVPYDGPADARAVIDGWDADAITHASAVPTTLVRIVREGRRAPHALRRLVIGGASCADAWVARALDLGYPAVRTYGMSESTAMVTLESEPLEGGSGRALADTSIRLVGGRIAVRAPTLASGFLEPLGSLPLDDGHFVTRDLGRFDAEALHVLGRVDHVIVRGGENVHPAEIEAVVEALPGIDAAVAFGEPDAEWGERVALAYVGRVAEPELSTCFEALPRYARPTRIVRFEAFDALPNGKTDRRAVVAAARAHGRAH